jgi:tetratricopeptide (TPR) repeat protein
MTILAKAYMRTGLHDKAAVLVAQALELHKELIGSDNPDALQGTWNLTKILWKQESYDTSILLAEQALDMRRRVLGSEHPYTLSDMHELVRKYYDHELYNKAIELGSELYEISERVLGPGHPDTLKRMSVFANLLHDVGRRQSASDLMALCAAKACELGPADPQTVRRQERAEDWRKEHLSVQHEEVRDNADVEAYDLMDEGF